MPRLAASAALGAASVLGFAPFYLFPLPILSLAALVHLAERAPGPRVRFACGFAFGLGFFGAGVSWVYVSLHHFGQMPAPVAAFTTLLFCAVLALYPALAVLAVSARVPALMRRAAAFPAAWTLTEWLRGTLFTGFPWLGLGYSQAPASPLAGYAPVLGVLGVTLAAALSAGLALHAIDGVLGTARRRAHDGGARTPRKLHRPAIAAIAALWALGFGLASVAWTTPAGAPVHVSLIQGNVPQDTKWRPEQVTATLKRYEELVLASSARLIVLPETAIPLFLQQVPADFLERLSTHARSQGADILIGLPELGAGRTYYNSVVSTGTSAPQAYRKSHLVPFGEFVPLRPLLGPVVDALAIPLTDFSRGSADQRPLAVAGERVAVNICYEDAFGTEIIRQLPEATLLVNVSNVAWFGDSIAPMQHLQIAQLRAIETGRAMLRATNTGMTAVIAPDGTVVAVAPGFEIATVEAHVRGHTGATPYVGWGDAPALATAALLALVALIAGWRGKRG